MKPLGAILFITLILFSAGRCKAQTTSTPTAPSFHNDIVSMVEAYRNDIGPMADVQVFSDALKCNVFGLQYRRQRSMILAWRVSAGVFDFQRTGTKVAQYPYVGDTIYSRRVDRSISGFALGFGLEAQRRFYRKVYFYAAADLRVGVGSAQEDTQHMVEYFGPYQGSGFYHQTYSYGSAGDNGTAVFGSLGVSVGARIYAGRRFIIGTEFSNPLYFTNSKVGKENGRTTDIDLSTDRVLQRLYISYRFR